VDESICPALATEEAGSGFMVPLDPQKLLLAPQQHRQIATTNSVATAETAQHLSVKSNAKVVAFLGTTFQKR
jgi:hypothetical protein